jgi:hypothetical protein
LIANIDLAVVKNLGSRLKVWVIGATVCVLLAACSSDQDQDQLQEPMPGSRNEEKPSLDLSRDALTETFSAESEDLAQPESALPDLFEDGKKQEKKTKLRGKVLTNEDAQDLRSSVDGFQIDLEIPTP